MRKIIYKCEKCGQTSLYSSEKCFNCGGKLNPQEITDFEVVGKVEVKIPSRGNEQTPYYDLLLTDKDGNFYIEKTLTDFKIGSKLTGDKKEESLNFTIGIIGSGQMGIGLAQVVLAAGHKVILTRRKKELLDESRDQIKSFLLKNNSLEDVEEILRNLTLSTDMKDFKDADFVIESATEDIGIKHEIFSGIEDLINKDTILCTNTSSILIKDVFANINRKDKIAGLHFFNPVPRMALVEVVLTEDTSHSTKEKLNGLVKSIGKTPVFVKDSPCFIVNRAMVPFLNEAVEILSEGVATPEEIDKAITLGLNHPIGPLALLDLIGLDVFVAITENLFSYKKQEKYQANKILYKMLKEGKLGRKTQEGFYSYKKES